MLDNADRGETTERDRPQVRPSKPGLAREQNPEDGEQAPEGEDFLPAD